MPMSASALVPTATAPPAWVVAVLAFAAAYLLRRRRAASSLPLPPGPPKDPIIGHVRYMPTTRAPDVYHAWAQTYGDVMHFSLPGTNLIVLGSHQAAVDLLEKRSANYSDRPPFPVYDLSGWTDILPFMSAIDHFRFERQVLHTYLTADKSASPALLDFQVDSARRLVDSLLKAKTEQYEPFFSRFATTLSVHLMTGHQIVSEDDPYLSLGEAVFHTLAETGPPGATGVDVLPILRYFPGWFPGAHYAGVARSLYKIVRRMYEEPIANVQKQREAGIAPPSFLLHNLERMDEGKCPITVEQLKGAAATLFAGAKQTTASTLSVFLLAMVLNQGVQRQAQAELDAVVGKGNLPTFADRQRLPYIEGLVQEVFRWNPVLPLCVPHAAREEDEYRGWRIPKGSVVIPNVKGISRDAAVYANPDQFDPTRFLPPRNEPRFMDLFGYGRRICLGRYVANNSMWITIASVLAACSITNALDANGKPIVPEVVMSDGIDCHPHEFLCTIKERN
ncbi:Cytochrome P450 [Mycena kentingensis (nom. inval.)]|nr:Cytochrome P450 [Mycena kentingensis (nom. inval.)]